MSIRNFSPYLRHKITKLGYLYAESGVDSYLHIDNYMSVNKNRFTKNSQLVFAEHLLQQESLLNEMGPDIPEYEDTLSDKWRKLKRFFGGGFTGVAKERANVTAHFNSAVNNIYQMIRLMRTHPESEAPEVLQELESSLMEIIGKLNDKKELIDDLSNKMQTVAFNKYQNLAHGDYASFKKSDLLRLDLRRENIYELLKANKQLRYILSRVSVPDEFLGRPAPSAMDPADTIRDGMQKYMDHFHTPTKTEYEALGITRDYLARFLKYSGRVNDINNWQPTP